MMAESYLIAHKVRGEAAFDIAQQMTCPECNGGTRDAISSDCSECDNLGYWWIIPTSGHRAYPYWHSWLDGLGQYSDIGFWPDPIIGAMPTDLPDHYTVNASPRAPKRNLLAELGLAKPKGHSAIIGTLVRRV